QAARLLEMMTDTLLLVKNDGTCVDMIVKTANNPYVNEEGTLLGKNIFDCFPQETLMDLRPAIEHVARTGEISNANYDLPAPEKIFYFKCIIQKYDEEHLLLQYRDITERSQMKLRLQLANERLQETGQAAKIGYWSYNQSTRLLYYEGYVGISLETREEVVIPLSEYLEHVFHEDRERIENNLTNPNSDVDTYDYRVVKDKIYYVRSKIINRYLNRKGEQMVDGYTQNIDDIVSNWDRLKMITLAVNNTNESIFAAKLDGTLIFANQLCRLMNHIPESADISNLKAYEVLDNFKEENKWSLFLKSLRANDNSLKFLCNHHYPDYDVISTECSAFIIRNDYGEDIIWNLGRDISEHVRYENKLKEAKEKAEESDRLKSAFLSNMSHEIRTPLNAIVGFSTIMAEVDDRDERMKFHKIIESNNNRLLLLINEVLDLSRIESGTLIFHFSVVSMHDLCREIFSTYQIYAGSTSLILEMPEEDISIRSDRNRLTQVLSNLIDNALKFTPKGSITIGYRVQLEWLELFVNDTGIGIPEDKQEKVFERFEKVNSFAQGTGLGLPICKTILERLGGDIKVTSQVGIGTQFTCRIPLLLTDSADDVFKVKPRNSSLQVSRQGVKSTILVAEDDEDNFELINAMIGNDYYLVHAKDGDHAIRLFHSINPDLILMDIKMPVMSGLEAIMAIRQESPFYPPIIAVSAYAFDNDRKELMKNGCKDFLTKPIDRELLIATVDKYL
ncbi:MAG TPA: response regulator, partial [Bacteroidales bacterium]|nr:response regulator [Bacteroidales bacterium]